MSHLEALKVSDVSFVGFVLLVAPVQSEQTSYLSEQYCVLLVFYPFCHDIIEGLR